MPNRSVHGVLLLLVQLMALVLPFGAQGAEPRTLELEASDGLTVTADLYRASPTPGPVVVLFHQAGWSRGEYREIAPRLSVLGFHALAVDQRSGDAVNGVPNETHRRARAKSLKTRYIDTIPDLRAALRYARKSLAADHSVVAWGSSYSAALVLRVVGEEPGLADAVLSFSPGEYFKKQGKTDHWVQDGAQRLTVPVFITAARKEEPTWRPIFDVIPSKQKTGFTPRSAGNHGSRALWTKFGDSDAYWTEVTAFLRALHPGRRSPE